MEDLAKIQAKFTLALELLMQAWNELLTYKGVTPSGLHPSFVVVAPKPEVGP
jgi:hypothetical protein